MIFPLLPVSSPHSCIISDPNVVLLHCCSQCLSLRILCLGERINLETSSRQAFSSKITLFVPDQTACRGWLHVLCASGSGQRQGLSLQTWVCSVAQHTIIVSGALNLARRFVTGTSISFFWVFRSTFLAMSGGLLFAILAWQGGLLIFNAQLMQIATPELFVILGKIVFIF